MKKKTIKQTQKLALVRKTMRTLQIAHLGNVAGGDDANLLGPSRSCIAC